MPTETRLTSINLFKSQADYEANKHNLTDGDLVAVAIDLIPVGTIYAFAGNNIPKGYLPCNGSAISRTTYADLFAVIGTTYGAGNGSTTFNLPNLTDKFIQGSDTAGTVKNADLPNITGHVEEAYMADLATKNDSNIYYDDGKSLYMVNATHVNKNADSGSSGYGKALKFDASKSSTIYGNSDTVQPPALTMRYIIKY